MLDSFRNHGGKTLLLASDTGEYFVEDNGIIFLRPLCEFSDADVIEYVKKYRLPSCSLDMAKGTLRPNDYSISELTDRLKDLGYL
jgi:tRNA(Ile)-lysidine synthase TilS/MesJ